MPEDLSPLWISLKTAFVATVLAAFLGILVARWMMTYRGKTRGLIDGVLTLPFSAAAYSGGVSPAAAAGQKQPGGAVSGSAGCLHHLYLDGGGDCGDGGGLSADVQDGAGGPLSRWI